jgi:hypothetical protein
MKGKVGAVAITLILLLIIIPPEPTNAAKTVNGTLEVPIPVRGQFALPMNGVKIIVSPDLTLKPVVSYDLILDNPLVAEVDTRIYVEGTLTLELRVEKDLFSLEKEWPVLSVSGTIPVGGVPVQYGIDVSLGVGVTSKAGVGGKVFFDVSGYYEIKTSNRISLSTTGIDRTGDSTTSNTIKFVPKVWQVSGGVGVMPYVRVEGEVGVGVGVGQFDVRVGPVFGVNIGPELYAKASVVGEFGGTSVDFSLTYGADLVIVGTFGLEVEAQAALLSLEKEWPLYKGELYRKPIYSKTLSRSATVSKIGTGKLSSLLKSL